MSDCSPQVCLRHESREQLEACRHVRKGRHGGEPTHCSQAPHVLPASHISMLLRQILSRKQGRFFKPSGLESGTSLSLSHQGPFGQRNALQLPLLLDHSRLPLSLVGLSLKKENGVSSLSSFLLLRAQPFLGFHVGNMKCDFPCIGKPEPTRGQAYLYSTQCLF